MRADGDTVREHVVDEMREAVHTLAHEGMPAKEIERHLNDGGRLTAIEQDLVYLLIYHATGGAGVIADP